MGICMGIDMGMGMSMGMGMGMGVGMGVSFCWNHLARQQQVHEVVPPQKAHGSFRRSVRHHHVELGHHSRLHTSTVRQHLSRCAMLRKKHIHTLNKHSRKDS